MPLALNWYKKSNQTNDAMQQASNYLNNKQSNIKKAAIGGVISGLSALGDWAVNSVSRVPTTSDSKVASNLPTAANYYQSQARATGAPVTSPSYYQSETRATGAQVPSVSTPKASTPSSFSGGTLYRGVKNNDVRLLQQLLGIPVDGSFGAQTEAAVKAFQKANGLTVDGRVGAQTKAALLGQKPSTSSSSSGSTSKSGGSSGGGAVKAPVVSTPAAPAPSVPLPEFQFDQSMPEFQFDYQSQPVQSLQELIALAAQQLNPQYEMIRNQARDQHKDNLQAIENDAIRRGRFQSTYAGNRQDNATSDYNELLSNIDIQQQSHANELGRLDYDKALAREDENYNRAYREAIDAYNRAMTGYDKQYDAALDAYNRAWNQYQDSYNREQDAWQRSIAEKELAMQEKYNNWQMSQPKYSSSGYSSSGSTKPTSNQSRTELVQSFTNNAIKAVDELVRRVKSRSISPPDAIKALYEEMNAIRNGEYGYMTPEETKQALEYIYREREKLKTNPF